MSSASTHLLELEIKLISEPDPVVRLAVLQSFPREPIPEASVLSLIVDVLDDSEPTVREAAAQLLLKWERKAAAAVLTSLRSTATDKIERRKTRIHMLGRFGSTAGIAETLLRSYDTDENVAADAKEALLKIRNDWGNLARGLTEWGLEALLITAAVAMPALGIILVQRPHDKDFPWIPTILGILGGAAALIFARVSLNVFNPKQVDERSQKIRRVLTTIILGAVGLGFGYWIGKLAMASKAATEQVIPK